LIRRTSDWPARTTTLSFTHHRKCRSPALCLGCSASRLVSPRPSCPRGGHSSFTEHLPRLPPGHRRHPPRTRRLSSLQNNNPTSTPPCRTQKIHTRVVRVPLTRRFTFSSSLKSSAVCSISPAFTSGMFAENYLLAYRNVDRSRTVFPTSVYHHVSIREGSSLSAFPW